MRWQVQLGNNGTSGVGKIFHNWTSRRGESNLVKFPNTASAINP